MTNHAQAIELLESNLVETLTLIAGIPAAERSKQPPSGGWSIDQIIDHLAVVEVRTGRLITRHLTRQSATEDELAATIGAEDRMRQRLRDSTPQIAPAMVQPEGRWGSSDATVAAFEAGRRETIEFARTTPVPLIDYVAPHPRLGPLTGLQWLLFLAEHTNRHLQQIRDRITYHPQPPTSHL